MGTPIGLVQIAQTIIQDCGVKTSLQTLPKAAPGPGILDATQKMPDVCERHHVEMDFKLVPIAYGFIIGNARWNKEAEQDAASQYPLCANRPYSPNGR